MLISVNGTIINTKRIYKITPIILYKFQSKSDLFWFQIFFNNNEKLDVISKEFKIIYPFTKDQIKDFENFRDSIIKIWQENQTEIPQFNL